MKLNRSLLSAFLSTHVMSATSCFVDKAVKTPPSLGCAIVLLLFHFTSLYGFDGIYDLLKME